MSDFNKDILRWVLLIGAMPIWWPFLRTLWRDFNAALREEGGLFGRPPTPREVETIRAEAAERVETLTSEPWVQTGQRRKTRLGAPPARSSAPGRGTALGRARPGAPANGARPAAARRSRFR